MLKTGPYVNTALEAFSFSYIVWMILLSWGGGGGGAICIMFQVWKSESNLSELVLFFHYVCTGAQS